MSRRGRYIARHGVFPWGILAGAAAAYTVVRSAWHDHTAGAGIGLGAIALLGALCFLLWTAVAGWAIGYLLWEVRGRFEPNAPRRKLG